jgi:acetoacetyl-CoA synthetase
VVDLPREGTDGVIELFVVLREGAELDDDLRKTLARAIRERCSPRHVPDQVRQVTAVPRTLSGKVVEVPVKLILTGADPTKVVSRDSLANPESLDYFVELSEYDS